MEGDGVVVIPLYTPSLILALQVCPGSDKGPNVSLWQGSCADVLHILLKTHPVPQLPFGEL